MNGCVNEKNDGGEAPYLRGIISKKHLYIMVLFIIYLFEFMMTQIVVDHLLYSGALSQWGVVLHYVMTSIIALGFISFGISRRIFAGIKIQKRLFIITYAVYFLGMTGACLLSHPVLSVCFSYIAIFALSFLGGAIYYYVAEGFVMHPYKCRIMGCCSAVAVLLQMALQNLMGFSGILVVILLGFALAVFGTVQLDNEWMFDEPLEFAADKDKQELASKKDVIVRMILIAFIFILISVTDKLCVEVTASGDTIMYAWPRFGLAIAYILIGFLADIGHGRYLFLITLCSLLPTIFVPFIMQAGYGAAGMFVYYMVVGSQILCASLIFWEVAPRTAFPELFSSMGRSLNSFVEILLIMPFLSGFIPGIILETVMLIGIVILMSLGGLLSPAPAGIKETEINRTTLFSERFSLTPREKDLLEILINNDNNMKEVASKLSVSERVAYRHLKNIYEKTGTSSRHQLMKKFYEV